MLLKAGVDISRLERNTRRGLQLVANIFKTYDQELIITSTFEGNHSAGSLHYANRAFDIRKPTKELKEIADQVSHLLEPDFDVVDESTHWHIEHDPK